MKNNFNIRELYTCCIFLSLFFLSCASKDDSVINDKKSKNNFLAYYNTFFIAEKSFEDALELMQTNTNNNILADNLSTQVKKLLDAAINNALIIERDFYQTKYLDDAYYILAMSSFHTNRITAAEYYFQKLVENFPDTSYLNIVNIQMGFIELKIGKINDFKRRLNLISINDLNNNEKYNYYNLLAYYHEYYNDYVNMHDSYLNAVEFAATKQERFFIYNKLLIISELLGNKIDSVFYIDKIQENNVSNTMDKELLKRWIEYQHVLNNHNDVLDKMKLHLEDSKTLKDKLFYSIGIARSYFYLKNYDEAEELLNDLIENNASSTVIKDERAEIYYLLGQISFVENQFEDAQERYQLSVDSSRKSEYGEKSQDNIVTLIKYTNYIEEIDYLTISSLNQDEDFFYEQNSLDSLIFHLAQIEYFDFGLKDSSLYHFKKIISDFPNSKYRNKSLVILDIEEPNTIWSELLEQEDLDNLVPKLNEVNILIDAAWDLLTQSNELCIKEFLRIYNQYNNDKALYIIAYIYDTYNHDLLTAMKYYKEYLEKHIDGEFYKIVNDRVANIKNMYEEQISILEQKINFKKGFVFFNSDLTDSSIFYFDLSSNGHDKAINLYSKSLKEKVNEYSNNLKLYLDSKDNNKQVDSLGYNLANILYSNFDADSLSKIYYLDLVDSDNDFKDLSYAALFKIDSLGGWDTLLYEMVNDSMKYNRILSRINKGNHLEQIKSINLSLLIDDLSWLKNNYNILYKEENEKLENPILPSPDIDRGLPNNDVDIEVEDTLKKNNLMKTNIKKKSVSE